MSKRGSRPRKANNRVVNQDFLDHRVKMAIDAGYTKQKWVEFCEEMLRQGFTVRLYEARRTVSKYITVSRPDDHSRSFKVRFSNHKPIKYRETAGDCDFFVGRTHLGVTTTQQAIEATVDYFRKEKTA